MLACAQCHTLRILLKFFVSVIVFWLSIIAGTIVLERELPIYQEPLSGVQKEMKGRFLSEKIKPEVLTTKDGTKIYYYQLSGTVTTQKPEWLSLENEVVLTNNEIQQIGKHTIINKKILGIEFKDMSVDDVNGIVTLALIVYLFGMMTGVLLSFYQSRETFVWGYTLAIGAFFVFLSWLDFGTDLLIANLFSFVLGLILGLTTWLIDIGINKALVPVDLEGKTT